MSPTNELLTKDELDRATRRLGDPTLRPFRSATIFHNALQSFLREVDIEQNARPIHKIMCVDTTEIAAFTLYNRAAWNAFTFGGLIDPENRFPASSAQRSREMIRNLDILVTRQVLFGRRSGFVLLEPHADELNTIADALSQRVERLDNTIDQSVFEGDVASLTETQLARIQEWLTHPDTDQQEEFETFRNTFLPGLRNDFVERLSTSLKAHERFEQFSDSANYRFIESANIGKRSFLTALQADGVRFDWQRFVSFSKGPEIASTSEIIVNSVTHLLQATERNKTISHEKRQLAISRDAKAVATVHVLNLFLENEDLPVRVEFVSRAPIMHSVVGAIPPDRLQVTIRHPMLLPDAYNFDLSSLQTLRDVFQSVSQAMAPLADASDAMEIHRAYPQIEPIIKSAAHEMVGVLSNVVVVRHTLELGNAASAIESSLDPSALKGGAPRDYSHAIVRIFERLADRLRMQSDPFSVDAINAIADNNYKLMEIERNRIGESVASTVKFHYSTLQHDVSGFPVDFVAFRAVGGRIPRMFHMYSESVPKLFVENGVREDASLSRTSRPISILELLDHSKSAFAAGKPQSSSAPARNPLEDLERTSLACIAFASLGRYATAVTLASTILNQIMRQLSVSETGNAKFMRSGTFRVGTDPRLPLALKELFLIRQYCERAIAREDLESESGIFGKTKGTGIQDFDRAERDLYLAVRMSEHAETLAAGKEVSEASPEGLDWFEDTRIALICFFGWMDHYIAASVNEQIIEPKFLQEWRKTVANQIWHQHDRWTSVSWARDIHALAHRAHMKAEKAQNTEARRYFGYVEYSAYHGLLVLFLSHLVFDVASEVQVFWNPLIRPNADRIFAFGKWKQWHESYKSVLERFDFGSRIGPLFGLVFDALSEIENVAGASVDFSSDQRVESQKGILERLSGELRSFRQQLTDVSDEVTFSVTLLDALVRRVELLQL